MTDSKRLTVKQADGFCQCGCGGKTGIADRTRPGKGHINGQPFKFRAGHGRRLISKPIADRFWEKVKRGPGCWEWQASKASWGYGQIGRGRKGAGVYRTHRLSWEINNGPIPEGMCVLHKCDNPPCVRPDHSFLGTLSDNTNDAARKGRMPRGESHPNTILTEVKINEIKEFIKSGLTQRVVADKYGISSSTVSNVIRGKTWKHVTA